MGKRALLLCDHHLLHRRLPNLEITRSASLRALRVVVDNPVTGFLTRRACGWPSEFLCQIEVL